MEQTIKAIEAAYSTQIGGIYRAFAQSILAAGSDDQDILEAESKFSKGLTHANDVRERALELVN